MADAFKLEYQFDPPIENFIVPEEMQAQALNELEVTMMAAQFALHEAVTSGTPHAFGFLRDSILPDTVVITGSIVQGGVSTVTPYALPVEEGAKPHWIPIAPLKLWAKRKFGKEGLAYWIQLKHAPTGAPKIITNKKTRRSYIVRGRGVRLKAHHMFSKGLASTKTQIEGFFSQTRERIIRKWSGK